MTSAAKYPPELIERICDLAAKGFSRTKIARRVGMTRNAVIGLLWRIANPDYEAKRPPRDRTGRRVGRPSALEVVERPVAHVYKPEKIKPVVLPPVPPRLDPKPRVGRPIIEATCCWHGCTAPAIERGKPYCETHRRQS